MHVGEARAYVQGESLKARALSCQRVSNSPTHHRENDVDLAKELERIEKQIEEDEAGFWTARTVIEVLRLKLAREAPKQKP